MTPFLKMLSMVHGSSKQDRIGAFASCLMRAVQQQPSHPGGRPLVEVPCLPCSADSEAGFFKLVRQ